MSLDPVRILLAEDDEGHARLVEKNLARVGFVNQIVHVHDGQEAMDYLNCAGGFADREPSGALLVLLDVKMPRMDGIEVLQRIKADPRLCKLPVIMLTTTDDPREVKRCYDLGCSVYVTKPVEYDAFVDAIQRIGLFVQVVTVNREDELQRGA